MFRALIEELLGGWGTVVLEFVLENSVLFSTIVVAVGIVLIIRKRRNQAKEEETTKTKETEGEPL